MLSIAGYSQTANNSLLRVHYVFKHVADTNFPDKPIVRSMQLDVSTRYSSFYLEKKEPAESKPETSGTTAPVARKRVMGMPSVMINSDPMAKEYLYQSIADKEMITIVSPGIGRYQIVSPLPVIKWKVQKTQKTIGTYTCQKATGSYGGRNYTAWFAPSLAFTYGPWKLNGLPGLILEASDDQGHVSFVMEKITEGNELFSLEDIRKSTKPLSEQEYEKAKQRFANDPVGTAKSSLPAGVADNIAIMYEDETGKILSGQEALEAIKAWSKKVINNPLELQHPGAKH